MKSKVKVAMETLTHKNNKVNKFLYFLSFYLLQSTERSGEKNEIRQIIS